MTDSETWRYHTTTGRRGGASTVPRLLLCVGSAAVITRRWVSLVFHAEQNCAAAPIEPSSSRRYFCHLCVGANRMRRASEEEVGRSGRVLSLITIQRAGIFRPPLLVVGLLVMELPTRYSYSAQQSRTQGPFSHRRYQQLCSKENHGLASSDWNRRENRWAWMVRRLASGYTEAGLGCGLLSTRGNEGMLWH